MALQPVPPLVLITGVTGYIGSVVSAYTLAAGYRVRGTCRDVKSRKVASIAALRGPDGSGRVEFVEAELDKAEGWDAAVKGATYILHVASPVPTDTPRDAEAEVIRPAVSGVLHVLRAAAREADQTVRRVVLTSSIAAVNEGRQREWSSHVFMEEDWSDVEAAGPYPVSKTKAERAAWAFMAETSGSGRGGGGDGVPRPLSFDLSVVNPGLVIGPPATDAASSSTIIYTRLFSWGMPAVPDLTFWTVDVRDVALAHLRAMTRAEAGGRRFICVAEEYSFRDLARDLNAEFAPRGCPIPTRSLPSWVVRLAACFDGALAVVAPALGARSKLDSGRAVGVLGMRFRACKTGSVQGAYALLTRGVLKDSSKGRAGGGSSVPVDRWVAYTPAPLGTPADEAAAAYPFTLQEVQDVAWRG